MTMRGFRTTGVVGSAIERGGHGGDWFRLGLFLEDDYDAFLVLTVIGKTSKCLGRCRAACQRLLRSGLLGLFGLLGLLGLLFNTVLGSHPLLRQAAASSGLFPIVQRGTSLRAHGGRRPGVSKIAIHIGRLTKMHIGSVRYTVLSNFLCIKMGYGQEWG